MSRNATRQLAIPDVDHLPPTDFFNITNKTQGISDGVLTATSLLSFSLFWFLLFLLHWLFSKRCIFFPHQAFCFCQRRVRCCRAPDHVVWTPCGKTGACNKRIGHSDLAVILWIPITGRRAYLPGQGLLRPLAIPWFQCARTSGPYYSGSRHLACRESTISLLFRLCTLGKDRYWGCLETHRTLRSSELVLIDSGYGAVLRAFPLSTILDRARTTTKLQHLIPVICLDGIVV